MRAKIIEFLELSKLYELTKKHIDQSLGEAEPDEQNGIFKSMMEQKLSKADLHEIVLPFYEKHFSEEEMDSVLDFFRSAVGQKMININITNETELNTIISDWFQSKFQAVIAELGVEFSGEQE